MPLHNLPSELLHTILAHLDIPSLLSFSRTSSTNHTHHLHTLHTLHLAVFPKRVQSLIAFLQRSDSAHDFDALQDRIAITLPQRPNRHTKPNRYRHSVIASQNEQLTSLLRRYGKSLETLSFHAWDILPETASVLAENCFRLRYLSLCFDHSASRDPCIPARYFEEPTKASSLWNSLAGLGAESNGKLLLRNLVSLRLERAGCTSAQLRGIISRNPGLKELRLRKVRGVDEEFVDWLGSGANKCCSSLRLLCIEECKNLNLQRPEDYFWLSSLEGLTSLRISGCVNVDMRKLTIMNDDLKIKQVGGYWNDGDTASERSSEGGILEVDEACQ